LIYEQPALRPGDPAAEARNAKAASEANSGAALAAASTEAAAATVDVMGDLFKSLSSGIAQFVYAWILPSALTCGAFSVLVLAHLEESAVANISVWIGGALFTLGTLTLSVVFAYAARAIFRVLEGISLPKGLQKRLLKRQHRRYNRLMALAQVPHRPTAQEATEQLKAFPDDSGMIMPTRLGNALKAMESYGVSRFGLDSQTFWYELQAAAPDAIRTATRETRASVDFFISSIAHLTLLSFACLAALPFVDNPVVIAIAAVLSLSLTPLAYAQASANVLEWHWSIRALVNTSREGLASSLGLALPTNSADEWDLWQAVSGLAHYGRHDDYLRIFDANRVQSPATASSGPTLAPSSSA
jgi:hypothetical protein